MRFLSKLFEKIKTRTNVKTIKEEYTIEIFCTKTVVCEYIKPYEEKIKEIALECIKNKDVENLASRILMELNIIYAASVTQTPKLRKVQITFFNFKEKI